jgi:hypothetical protein
LVAHLLPYRSAAEIQPSSQTFKESGFRFDNRAAAMVSKHKNFSADAKATQPL